MVNKAVDWQDTSGQPVVGICINAVHAKWAVWEQPAYLIVQAFVDRVAAAGCTPLLLPPMPGIEHSVARLDGLVLAGGGDLDPALYSATPHPKTGRISSRRDAAELAALDAALGAGLPILGICRGLHVLNVFLGGTLHQHIPDITGHHGHLPGPALFGSQPLRVEPASHLAKILDCDSAPVPCHHHQAVDRLGAGLVVSARSDDGTIEAVELPSHPFAVGVQWHAEESEDDRVFLAFTEAAGSASGAIRRGASA